MATYEAIETGAPLQASLSNLLAVSWEPNAMTADFILPHDDAHALRVRFSGPSIVRILDEMPLSTEEEDEPNSGLVSENFAYRIRGARFARHQSDGWKDSVGPVVHYRFITGWGCLDVLSPAEPMFAVIARTGI